MFNMLTEGNFFDIYDIGYKDGYFEGIDKTVEYKYSSENIYDDIIEAVKQDQKNICSHYGCKILGNKNKKVKDIKVIDMYKPLYNYIDSLVERLEKAKEKRKERNDILLKTLPLRGYDDVDDKIIKNKYQQYRKKVF